MNDPEASMKRLMTVRYPIYATADITVESREVPHDVIVGEVIDALTARLVPRENAGTVLNPNEVT
jgi:shikimate kinase